MSDFTTGCRGLVFAILALSLAGPATGQIVENTEDPFGIAIPHARIRMIHSSDSSQPGTSGHLMRRDPFLFYQTGRDLMHRQFELEHGAIGRPGVLDVPLYVGVADQVHGAPARFARDHSASCGMCHSSVYREPGAGPTIASTGSGGRNSTHFFGAGIVEMIGADVRTKILNQYDENGNGLIDRAEVAESRPVRIAPVAGSAEVDYGDLAPGPDGVPQLTTVFRLWFVDGDGKILPDAFGLDDERVAAYGFAMQPFGWGRGRLKRDGRLTSQGGEATTVREFYTTAADFHMGLQAHDPTQLGADPAAHGAGGVARVSLPGAQQFDFGGCVDLGKEQSEVGLSLDDPDQDGVLAELTEGDVDAIEFYLLHTPAPGVRRTETSEAGRLVMSEIGCTRCHVENWQIEAHDEEKGFTGDRRLFHLETDTVFREDGSTELTGKLVRLHEELPSGDIVPRRDGFLVEGIYTDFKHWDIGEAFFERRYDGSLQREHRTAPLWGIFGTATFGHSGAFVTLHDAISAHAGAAEKEAKAYRALPVEKQEELIEFLRSLVLYATDEIPADIDGDGQIAESFQVEEQEVGYERFDARFLFNTKPKYKRIHNIMQPNGRRVPMSLITNIEQAYGLGLPFRADADGDGFPDKLVPRDPEKEQGDEDDAR